MSVKFFPAIIEGGDQPGFCVFFPDLPGCTSAGNTIQEAARNAEDALRGHLQLMIEDNDPIPEPSELDQIDSDPEIIEVARILVRAELPGQSVRLNISMDEGLVQAIDQCAKARGVSRSGFLADAARNMIREHQRIGTV